MKSQQTSLLIFVAFWFPIVCRTGRVYLQNPLFVTMRRRLFNRIDCLHTWDPPILEKPNPNSALAKLNSSNETFSEASKSNPSNYFRCLLPLVAGAPPISTGVWYEGNYA
jgi:hypothetical protein